MWTWRDIIEYLWWISFLDKWSKKNIQIAKRYPIISFHIHRFPFISIDIYRDPNGVNPKWSCITHIWGVLAVQIWMPDLLPWTSSFCVNINHGSTIINIKYCHTLIILFLLDVTYIFYFIFWSIFIYNLFDNYFLFIFWFDIGVSSLLSTISFSFVFMNQQYYS